MKELQKLDAKKVVSFNIKKLRTEKGLTQVQLADKIGLTQSSLSQIEKGLRWPDYKTIVVLAKAFKCEHSDIISHPDLLEAFNKMDSLKKDK